MGTYEVKENYGTSSRLENELMEVHPGLLVAKLNGRGDSQSIQKLARLMKKGIAFLVDEVIDEQEVEPFVH